MKIAGLMPAGSCLLSIVLVGIGGTVQPSFGQSKERVDLRKVGRIEARPTDSATHDENAADNPKYVSPNGKFTGLAIHPKGEWRVGEFKLLDEAGQARWSRKDLPYGTFIISNQGHVVQRVGERGGKLQFFSDSGESLGVYENPQLATAQGFAWDKSGRRFVVVMNDGRASGQTLVFRPDGSLIFKKEHAGLLPGRVTITDKTLYIEGRENDKRVLILMDAQGTVLRKTPWARGSILSAEEVDGGMLLVTPNSCVVLSPGNAEIAEYKSDDKGIVLTEAIAAPKGRRVIVKYRNRGTTDDAGFVVLDQKASLIGKRELRSKKLRIKFTGEDKAEIETENDRYAVDID